MTPSAQPLHFHNFIGGKKWTDETMIEDTSKDF
jgi:hypothetical protein